MPSNDLNSLDGIIKNDVRNIEASNNVTQFISHELINNLYRVESADWPFSSSVSSIVSFIHSSMGICKV